jgi:hypothetical protein
LLARLLELFPAWVTGRMEPRARREVRSWTRGNATLRTYRYGRFRRLLMWGTDHPVLFAALAWLLTASVGYALAVQDWAAPWKIPAVPKSDFDIAQYTSIPWGIQATLVALVYPIVLSLIALMLQRKAHSTVSLRVYILDSAVVPAGASSVGLLIVLGIQYFAAPYSSSSLVERYLAPLLVMNGTWLLQNVLLTGFFLSRTVRFIQEEEQRHAFTRVAVDVALREELIAAVKQHIFVNAPRSDWGFPDTNLDNDGEPRVYTFSIAEGRPAVKRDIGGSLVLHDVHLRLLHLVAVLWKRRAAKFDGGRRGKAPQLAFPAMVGGEPAREVVLCSVNDGPPLRWFERLLVRTAFVYKPGRRGSLSLSTRRMLEEIGGEVEAAAEQQRFGAAEERLRDVLRLHRTLLLAGAADADAIEGNAATIGVSPYAWSHSSFDMEWLKPYRDVGRIAVDRLEDDPRLFRALAVVPAGIAARLPPHPEKLLINAQLVGVNLAYQLAGWWTRKADESLAPGATTFVGTLPAPLSKVYEQAVVGFIGSWGNFRVDVPNEFRGGDVSAWQAFAGRALVYASHIEHSARLLLQAVSRSDEAGSLWLTENFLKWWGNRTYELDCADIEYEFRVRHVTLTLANKDWEAAKNFLWDGVEPVTIEFAKMALSLAIRRYWESMRLYVVLLLIHNAGEPPEVNSLELRLAAVLIEATAQRAGGAVEARPLNTGDDMLTRLMANVFGAETADARLDSFAEKMRWDIEVPEVMGWIYSWSGAPTSLESMKRAQATLLVALAVSRRIGVNRCKELIERWWKDVDKLDRVQRYLADLRKEVLAGAFGDAPTAVVVLQTLLKSSHRPRACRFASAIALKSLRAVADRERQTTLRALEVDVVKVRDLARQIASIAFDATSITPPISGLAFRNLAGAIPMGVSFLDDRKCYLKGLDIAPYSGLAENIGDAVRQQLVTRSFRRLVAKAGLRPVNVPELRELYDPTHLQMRTYLSAVVQQCLALVASGEMPVILVGRSGARTSLGEHRWGSERWKCMPPDGIVVEAGDVSHPRAVSTINGVPVFEFPTPNNDCYVLSGEALKTLTIEGLGVETAMSIDWEMEGEEQLKFSICWKGGFS